MASLKLISPIFSIDHRNFSFNQVGYKKQGWLINTAFPVRNTLFYKNISILAKTYEQIKNDLSLKFQKMLILRM